MNRFNNGHLLLWKTIFYLNDRDKFEYSWHDAFTRVDFPVFVVWGDDDAVAPAIIGSSIAEIIQGAEHRSKDGVGHFLMLEDPKFWTESIVEFLSKAGLPGLVPGHTYIKSNTFEKPSQGHIF